VVRGRRPSRRRSWHWTEAAVTGCAPCL